MDHSLRASMARHPSRLDITAERDRLHNLLLRREIVRDRSPEAAPAYDALIDHGYADWCDEVAEWLADFDAQRESDAE